MNSKLAAITHHKWVFVHVLGSKRA